MPLQLPNLDDRSYDELLAEAKRRIPVHTPEWTNFDVESDPGITIVQLFAFLTDSLLYRANRIPERNRLKFLQLLGIPLRPAAAATGIIAIRNERGPLEALTLGPGVIASAGNVNFLTRDDVTVLPLEALAFYKKKIDEDDERYADLVEQHQATLTALEIAREEEGTDAVAAAALTPVFYETATMTLPTAGNPNPELDLRGETLDNALYLALLAPKNVDPALVRDAIANKTLSLGVVPATSGEIESLQPDVLASERAQASGLIYELPDTAAGGSRATYRRLTILEEGDVLEELGVVKLVLPGASRLDTWAFAEPNEEGSGDYPPRIEDEAISKRLVTWLRLRLPAATGETSEGEETGARFTWVGVNVTRVVQAVPVVNELLGSGTGEPEQTVALANTPVLPESVALAVQQADGSWQPWRQVDDLLAAEMDDRVYTLDPESGAIRFGTGLHGQRPGRGQRLRASYEYGGGRQGNVAVGEIKSSTDVRLQGGFKIENPVPTSGGDEGETVAEGEANIPLYLRHRDRLVTAQDFADITRRTPGVDVGRVEVLALFYPPQPATPQPGVVTVMAIPEHDAIDPLWPAADRLFLRRICDHIATRRLVTTEIFVRGPAYVNVNLSVGIEVREGYYRDEVIQAVRDTLRLYLSSLPPGGPDGEGWPLARKLQKKELEAVAARVPGVAFVDSLYMGIGNAVDVEEYDGLSELLLPRVDTIAVRAGEAELLEAVLGQTEDVPDEEIVPIAVTPAVC
jgi:hypothetical protein